MYWKQKFSILIVETSLSFQLEKLHLSFSNGALRLIIGHGAENKW